MSDRVTVSDDLSLGVGRARAALTPGEAFAVAERLIRVAMTRIVLDAADAAMVRGVVADPTAYLRDDASRCPREGDGGSTDRDC